jgi:hypothetical protein
MPAVGFPGRQAGVDQRQHRNAGITVLREEQEKLLHGLLELGDSTWHGMRADRVWSLWSRYACTAFYSHPWAWNEIGFGGPAYPRGYLNAGIDAREKWEVADHHDVDPIPFAERAERARQSHAASFGSSNEGNS